VSDVAVTVTGQDGIQSGALLDAWILPRATADHSSDEHVMDPPRITAGNIVPNVGFTVYGLCNDNVDSFDNTNGGSGSGVSESNEGNLLTYGKWTVCWSWC